MSDLPLAESWEPFRWNIVEALNEWPEVRWDRFVEDDEDGRLRIYGWVDRLHSPRADFLLMDFELGSNDDGEPTISSWILTSSVVVSDRLAAKGEADDFEGKHAVCQRVEHHFGTAVPGAIRLVDGR